MKFKNGVIEILSDSSDDEIGEVESVAVHSRVKVEETFYNFQARHHTSAYLNAGMGEEEAMAKAMVNSKQTLKRSFSKEGLVKEVSSKRFKSSTSKSESAVTPKKVGVSPTKLNASLLREPRTKQFVGSYETSHGFLCCRVMEQTFGPIGNIGNKEKILRFFSVIKLFQIAMKDFVKGVEKTVGVKYDFLFAQRHTFLMAMVSIWKYPDLLPLTSEGLQRTVAGIGHGTAEVISKILDVNRFGINFEQLPIILESYVPKQAVMRNGKPCMIIKSVAWNEFLRQHNWGAAHSNNDNI